MPLTETQNAKLTALRKTLNNSHLCLTQRAADGADNSGLNAKAVASMGVQYIAQAVTALDELEAELTGE